MVPLNNIEENGLSNLSLLDNLDEFIKNNGEIKQFINPKRKNRIVNEKKIFLSEIMVLFRFLGFKMINIIDFSCRSTENTTVITENDLTNIMREERARPIHITYGGRKRRFSVERIISRKNITCKK